MCMEKNYFNILLVLFYRTTLARWRAAQIHEKGAQNKERRPYIATECNDLPKAEKWRIQIIREIAQKVSQIQNGNEFNLCTDNCIFRIICV